MKPKYSVSIALILSLALATATLAAVIKWPDAEDAQNISRSHNVRSNGTLVVRSGQVSTVWASEEAPNGVYVAQDQGSGTWTTQTLALTGDKGAWYPSSIYSGTQLLTAWTQGDALKPGSITRTIMQKDGLNGAVKLVADELFGYSAVPDMAFSPTGLHMVYASAANSTDWSKGDLYYVHRALDATSWSTPVKIVDYNQVIPSGSAGGIWYPQLAVNTSGTTLHVVWEQVESGPFYTPWYIEGTWDAGTVNWGTPQRLSPEDQDYGVRPNVAVDSTGSAHVVWSELITGTTGSTIDPEKQYINYKNLGRDARIQLNQQAIKVNDNFPTWAASSISINDATVCVTWHGYYDTSPTDLEEITLRCSLDWGQTWQAEVNASESQNLLSIFSDVQVDSTGKAHVVWTEYDLPISEFVSYDFFYRTGGPRVPVVYLPIVYKGSF